MSKEAEQVARERPMMDRIVDNPDPSAYTAAELRQLCDEILAATTSYNHNPADTMIAQAVKLMAEEGPADGE